MKEEVTKVICDLCGKNITTNRYFFDNGYDGWASLQLDDNELIDLEGNDFCSKKCLLKYLAENIKEDE